MVKNCPESAGGKQDLSTLFLSYQPFPLSVPGKVPASEASTDTSEKWRKLQGMSGVNFCPTRIGGDSFRVVADLDFAGLPNKADLEAWHGAAANGRDARKVETGVVTVWRDTRFAAIVKWPGVSTPQYELDRIGLDYEQCYVEMAKTPKELSIEDVITGAEYQELIRQWTPKNLEAQLQLETRSAAEGSRLVEDATPDRVRFLGIPLWQKFGLTKDALYGRDLPPQKSLDGEDYKAAIRSLFYTPKDGFVYKLSRPLAALVSRKLRPEHPLGHLVVAFHPHRPVKILNDGADRSKGVLENAYVASFVSHGLPDGVVTYDLGDPDRRGYVVAHEFGHHYFLYHHQTSQDETFDTPTQHDTTDLNCIMSYAVDGAQFPRVPTQFNPLFCGKCNLRLRGWRVTSAGVPASSPP
jgi:hypothetical protein